MGEKTKALVLLISKTARNQPWRHDVLFICFEKKRASEMAAVKLAY